MAAENIYGSSWNQYSNALLHEALYVYEKCIAELQVHFDRIDYLEIGSCQGLSISVVGLMLKDRGLLGDLVSVDPYFEDGYDEGAKLARQRNIRINVDKRTKEQAFRLYTSLGINVSLLEMKSSEGLVKLLKENRRYHLIYIDGSHEALNPTVDFGLSCALCHSNGIVMLDDHLQPDVIGIKSLCDRHCVKVADCWKVAAYKISCL